MPSRKVAVGDIPKRVEEYAEGIRVSNPDYTDAQAYATAWSIFCKYHHDPEHCSRPPGEYLVGRREANVNDRELLRRVAGLAKDDPALRSALMPIIREAADPWAKLPKGWTRDSLESYWDTLTGDVKHKVTKCIKKMEGTGITDPGAFCASIADKMEPGWRSRRAEETDVNDRELLKKVARIAKDHPETRSALMPILREASGKAAHGAVAIKNPDVMLYMIDPEVNASKFYEMAIVPADEATPAKSVKRWSGDGGPQDYTLERRWGRLTDRGGITGRVDSMNDTFGSRREAEMAMAKIRMEKTRKGYQDVSRTKRYPIGLGPAGFGWGGQAACPYVPELQAVRDALQGTVTAIERAARAVMVIRDSNPTFGKELKDQFDHIRRVAAAYARLLDQQLVHCE